MENEAIVSPSERGTDPNIWLTISGFISIVGGAKGERTHRVVRGNPANPIEHTEVVILNPGSTDSDLINAHTSTPGTGSRGRSLPGIRSEVRDHEEPTKIPTPKSRAEESVREKPLSTRPGIINTKVPL